MANSLLSIEATTCTFCGDCATACPMGLIAVDAAPPQIPDDAAEGCVLCGHCIAACPEGILNHRMLDRNELLPLDPAWRSTPEVVEQLFKGRRSIRRYQPEPVQKSVLESVLDIARYAPTGMNSQTVHWLVVYDRAEVRKLASAVIEWMREETTRDRLIAGRYNASPLVAAWDAGHDPILRGCPHVIIAHGLEKDLFAQSSCTIALTTLELAVLPYGLGTCWAGFLHLASKLSQEVRDTLGLPPGHVMNGGLMIGYPQETYHAIPPRKKLKVAWR